MDYFESRTDQLQFSGGTVNKSTKMKSKICALVLLLNILHLSAAKLIQISPNETTTISRERNSLFIDYFNLLVNTHDQLQNKVNILDSSNKILGVQLADAESKIVNDTSVIRSKDQQIKDQQNEIKERDDQVKDTNEQLLLKDEQIKETNLKFHLQDDQIRALSADLNEKEERLDAFMDLKLKVQKQLRVCEDQVKEGGEVINLKDEQIKEANELLKKQDEQMKNKSAELKESEGRVYNMSEIIQNLQSQLGREIKTHNDQIQLKVNEIANQTHQIQNKDAILFNMTGIIRSLKSLLLNAETQIKEKIDIITSKNEDFKNLAEQHKIKNEQFSKENEELKTEKQQLINKCEQLKQKDELLASKTNEINIQREQIKNNQVQISSLNNQIESVTSELKNKTNQLLAWTELQQCPKGLQKGISSIKLPGVQEFKASCNSGWMTIQKRIDGTESFNRLWDDYRHGFGNLQWEFFLGLEKLYQLTKAQPHKLLIYLKDQYGNRTQALYDDFQIGSEEESYYLKSLGKFTGTTADGLKNNLGMKFSTFDRDNDLLVGECAKNLLGAWWFNKCGDSSLNGKYYASGGNVHAGIFWPIFVGGKWKNNISYTSVEMMIKPKVA